jgi:hypothetical protein
MSGEPNYLTLRDAAYWQSRSRHKARPGPRPTLGDLQRSTPWVWLWCERCHHHAPFACAPAVIRWGVERHAAPAHALHVMRRQGRDVAASRLGRHQHRLSAVSSRSRASTLTGGQSPRCSPGTRRGGSRPTWRSCRSCSGSLKAIRLALLRVGYIRALDGRKVKLRGRGG